MTSYPSALRLFGKPQRLAVAVKLYDLAAAHQWGAFEASKRMLMDTGASWRDVAAVVELLKQHCELEVVSPGRGRRPCRFRLPDPSAGQISPASTGDKRKPGPKGLDVTKHLKVIRRMYGRHFAEKVRRAGLDEDDMMQTILQGILVRNQGKCPYDPSKAKVTTYLYMIMRGVVLNELEKAGRFAAHYSYAGEEDVASSDLATVPEHYGASWETARDRIAGIVAMALEGHTQADIVRATGLSRTVVKKALVGGRGVLSEQGR